jgi:hypothetical protein
MQRKLRKKSSPFFALKKHLSKKPRRYLESACKTALNGLQHNMVSNKNFFSKILAGVPKAFLDKSSSVKVYPKACFLIDSSSFLAFFVPYRLSPNTQFPEKEFFATFSGFFAIFWCFLNR